MRKRIHILMLAVAGVLAIGASSFAATTSLPAFKSSPRATSVPVAAGQNQAAAAAAKVKAAQKAVTGLRDWQRERAEAARGSTRRRDQANAAALAKAKAKVKSAQKALATAQKALAKAKNQAG